MATITTFSTLKTYAADVLDRTDISTVGGALDVWIELAEDDIYRDQRLRFMEASTSPTIASGVVPIPSDFLEMRQAHVLTDPATKIEPRPSEWIYTQYPQRSADGVPKFYALEGDNLIFGPYPDGNQDVQLNYYARPAALSTSNETNWLTTNASDVLLYGVLLQSVVYLGDDERRPMWDAAYERGMARLKRQQTQERFGQQQNLRVVPG